MIDAVPISHDIGLLRTSQAQASATALRRAGAQTISPMRDPNAPTGPRPTFEMTTLQALQQVTPLETMQSPPMPERADYTAPPGTAAPQFVDRTI